MPYRDCSYYMLKLPLFDLDIWDNIVTRNRVKPEEVICIISTSVLRWNGSPFEVTVTLEQLEAINKAWDELLTYNEQCLKK